VGVHPVRYLGKEWGSAAVRTAGYSVAAMRGEVHGQVHAGRNEFVKDFPPGRQDACFRIRGNLGRVSHCIWAHLCVPGTRVSVLSPPLLCCAVPLPLQARGEMQLAVVIESLRREGLELAVSPPQVVYR
jgi:hypothetical protein